MANTEDQCGSAKPRAIIAGIVGAFVAVVAAILALFLIESPPEKPAPSSTRTTSVAPGPIFERTFWETWGDGQAELAGYDLTMPRYRQLRKGTAVTIFVTETFSNSLRVKADPGVHPAGDEFPAMKLNLIKDFQTGVYDYNEMTSVFAALKSVNARPVGALTKVSFSAQEWCGHAWHQLLFDPQSIRSSLHSYFDGEADSESSLANHPDGVSEDQLLLWARGMSWPQVEPGQSVRVQFLPSLQSARHDHKNLSWVSATLSRQAETRKVSVPAGTLNAEVFNAVIEGAGERTIYVETGGAHRIIRWESSSGERADLLASDRMKYWEMNAEGGQRALGRLGLSARPPRTP